MIYYDLRIDEWVKDLDTDYMAPELYFVIKESEDGKQHHVFDTDKGIKEIVADNDEDFREKFSQLQSSSKYVRRKEWHLPSAAFHQGCKHFGLED